MSAEIERKIPEEIARIVREEKRFLLLTHVFPDGDALGSLFGMAAILRAAGKEVLCFTEEPVSHLFDFLPDCRNVTHDLDQVNEFITRVDQPVVTLSMDCGESARLGKHERTFLKNQPFLVIDHHKSHKSHGDYRWVEPNRSSTGEMIYELALALNYEVPLHAAFDLYVAISTDTGSFRYECTGPRTLQIASELLALGVKPDEVSRLVYDNYTKERLKLMEMVLSTLELHQDEQIATIYTTRKMFEESGAQYQDVEGFVDFPRALKCVKVVAFIKEAQAADVISVSLRAKGECDVAEIAKQFNGGGHRNAAGFRCNGKNIEQVRADVLDALRVVF